MRGFFRSLRTLLELEDFAEVWLGHIGGSLCGGSGMSEKPGSTIGFERRFNPILALATRGDEEEFVRVLTDDLALAAAELRADRRAQAGRSLPASRGSSHSLRLVPRNWPPRAPSSWTGATRASSTPLTFPPAR